MSFDDVCALAWNGYSAGKSTGKNDPKGDDGDSTRSAEHERVELESIWTSEVGTARGGWSQRMNELVGQNDQQRQEQGRGDTRLAATKVRLALLAHDKWTNHLGETEGQDAREPLPQ